MIPFVKKIVKLYCLFESIKHVNLVISELDMSLRDSDS